MIYIAIAVEIERANSQEVSACSRKGYCSYSRHDLCMHARIRSQLMHSQAARWLHDQMLLVRRKLPLTADIPSELVLTLGDETGDGLCRRVLVGDIPARFMQSVRHSAAQHR